MSRDVVLAVVAVLSVPWLWWEECRDVYRWWRDR